MPCLTSTSSPTAFCRNATNSSNETSAGSFFAASAPARQAKTCDHETCEDGRAPHGIFPNELNRPARARDNTRDKNAMTRARGAAYHARGRFAHPPVAVIVPWRKIPCRENAMLRRTRTVTVVAGALTLLASHPADAADFYAG